MRPTTLITIVNSLLFAVPIPLCAEQHRSFVFSKVDLAMLDPVTFLDATYEKTRPSVS